MMGRRTWGMAAGLLALLAGCGGEASGPVFRAAPPEWPAGVAGKATASAGVLSGDVYMATSTEIDASSGLPLAYGPLPDGNAVISVRQAGSRNSWQGVIASGSYRLAGLPLGVRLEVTASKFGLQPRSRSVTIAPHGQGRLSFAYFGGSEDSYLTPQPPVQAPSN